MFSEQLKCSPNSINVLRTTSSGGRSHPQWRLSLKWRGVNAPKTGCSVGWMSVIWLSVGWLSVGWIAHPLHEGGLLLRCGQAAVIDDDDAIGYIQDLVVVGDHDDRGVLLTGQLLHQLHHGAA